MSVRIASSNLNQTPLDWRGNFNNIKESISLAKEKKVEILCLPELSITGYGCQDLFYHDWFIKKSNDVLDEIRILSKSITVIVGHPLSFNNKNYNSCCIIRDQKILGFFIKSNLPNDGIHYEKRWFEGWEYGKIDKINFDWKENQRPALGVIAQEIEKVLPELVTDNGTKTVNYNGLIGLLIEAVKAQQEEIDMLKSKIK